MANIIPKYGRFGTFILYSDHKEQVNKLKYGISEFIDWFGSGNSVNVALFEKLPQKAQADLENLRKLLKES